MHARVVKLSNENDKKLSLELCKKILNVDGNVYSDQEILRIREFLYELAEIECRHFKDWQQQQTNRIITINRNDYETTESYSLYPSEYRRAS
jgi:hypothetical protein